MGAGAQLARGAAIRLAFGISALLEPEATSRLLGVPRKRINRSGSYALRLFAARDVILGLATAAAGNGDPIAQRRAIVANLAAEAADSAALLSEARDRGGVRGELVGGALFNVAGYATWLAAARALRRARS
jgi:uncharacterized protein DUF4267